MNPPEELISVVIPTAGKRTDSLVQAIRSVSHQNAEARIEIIVADDSEDGLDEVPLRAAAGPVNIHFVSTTRTRGLARQFGVEAASGDWVAFLDDDDTWEPNKLKEQLNLARMIKAEGRVPIVSCRFRHSFVSKKQTVGGIPRRLIANEDVARYLFLRRPARVSRPSLFTSTLLVPVSICRAIPWRIVPRHQDWDWLIRAQNYPGVKFAHCPSELATIAVGSSDSISALSDWRSSLEWAKSVLGKNSDERVYADFLCGQPLRYALQAREWIGVRVVLAEIVRTRKMPSTQSLATGLAGILSRRLMERIMSTAKDHARKKKVT